MPPTTTPEGGTSTQDPTAGQPADRSFTQADVDRIVQERLARDRARFSDYDELRRAADELAELKAKDETELQAAVRRAETAERERDETKGIALRLQVAIDKGLTPVQAKRLVGKTREELEADADDLLEAFGGKKADAGDGEPGGDPKGDGGKPAPGGDDLRRQPREALRSGSVPGSTSEPAKTPEQIADEISKSDLL